MNNKSFFFISFTTLLLSVVFLTSCSAEKQENAVIPVQATESVPSQTVKPTDTPAPHYTATPEPTFTPVPTPTPIPTISFRNGNIPIDTTNLTLIIEAGETKLFDQLPDLAECHLEGSSCYEEIQTFAGEHPEITVTYSVEIGGHSYPNGTKEIQLSDCNWKTEDFLNAFQWLPELITIDINGSPLTVSDCEVLKDFLGTAIINYSIKCDSSVISANCESLDWNAMPSLSTDTLISVIPYLSHLTFIDATNVKGISLEDIGRIQQSKQGLVVDYPIKLFGKEFSTASAVIDISNKKLKAKQLDEIRALAPYLTNCEKVVMENCGISNEIMDELRTELAPYTEIVWRIKCGPYSCRTDAVMIKFSGKSSVLTDSKAAALSYCHDIVFLDLGHNHIRHIDFIANMPNLEVCIIAVNYLIDISPISNCKKLEYCEFLSNVKIDVTPLAECTELKHLNISYTNCADITPLFGLKKLERLWISRNPIPDEQIAQIKELLPSAEINTTSHNCTGEGWRENARYDLLREQFRYDNSHVRSYYYLNGEIVEDLI